MEQLICIIEDWYNKNESDIAYDTRMLYFIELFQELKAAEITSSDMPEIGEKILCLLEQDFIDESIHMVYQRRLAGEINYAYRSVMRNIDEIEDEPVEITQIKKTDDGDTYVNNTSEPDIDLRGVDLGETTFDEAFIRRLGIKK